MCVYVHIRNRSRFFSTCHTLRSVGILIRYACILNIVDPFLFFSFSILYACIENVLDLSHIISHPLDHYTLQRRADRQCLRVRSSLCVSLCDTRSSLCVSLCIIVCGQKAQAQLLQNNVLVHNACEHKRAHIHTHTHTHTHTRAQACTTTLEIVRDAQRQTSPNHNVLRVERSVVDQVGGRLLHRLSEV